MSNQPIGERGSMATRCYYDEKWEFRASDTKQGTHCFHNYPAMMIPQIANALLEKYGKRSKFLFDPYCGSGTSLVEASLRGINSVGTDLNPLARLLAKVKTTPVDQKSLGKLIASYCDETLKIRFNSSLIEECIPPTFMNIDYWFDKEIQRKLSFIKKFIDDISDHDIRNFFKVAFSETVRECSWTRNGEFKLFRMSEKQRETFNPDVFAIMEGKLRKNRNGLVYFMNNVKSDVYTKVCDFNTVEDIPVKIIPDSSIDIIVTSPPYGDSKTTVAYGQYSRLSSQWLGFESPEKVDNILMGGRRNKGEVDTQCQLLLDQLSKIRSIDSKRANDVESFYIEYKKSINKISEKVKDGAHVCYVVGNRKVKGIKLQTDEITRHFFEENGFMHIETIIRGIPNKRMPSKNSPSNITGQLDNTMTHEYIVVMKKV